MMSRSIGDHQVCAKWLKDRKGRVLSADDITHYHRIVVALHETLRLMAEIDKTIDAHGGRPAAFNTEPRSVAQTSHPLGRLGPLVPRCGGTRQGRGRGCRPSVGRCIAVMRPVVGPQ